MAIPSNTIWEVRGATGSDGNGGGFLITASGTDYSQQASPQYALTGLTTAAANAIILTASAAAVMVGNCINITGGTNFITGIYQITAVSVGVSITVDRTCTSAAGAAGTGNVGGALATIAAALTAMGTTLNQRVYVKADGTYSITSTLTLPVNGNFDPAGASDFNRLLGYKTSRGDGRVYGNQAVIQLASGATVGITFASSGTWIVEGLSIDCNNIASSVGVSADADGRLQVRYCTIKNFKTGGFVINGSGSQAFTVNIYNCEVTGGSAGATAAINVEGRTNTNVYFNNVHDNACTGILYSSQTRIICNKITNNTGTTSDGIQGTYFLTCFGNLVYGSGRDGLRLTANLVDWTIIKNNIFAGNGVSAAGYGLNNTGTANPADFNWDGNAYYGNTSGARNGWSSVVGIYSDPAQYTYTLDQVISVDPFANAAGGNFMLNNTAGGGASLRAAGYPGIFFGDTTNTGYLDLGPLQHQDSGGGGGPIGQIVKVASIGTY